MIFLWVPETKQRTLEELDYICNSSPHIDLSDVELTCGMQLPFRLVNTCDTRSPRSYLGLSVGIYYEGTWFCGRFTNFKDRHDLGQRSQQCKICSFDK